MPAARATSDSVIDDQSRLSSNSRIPSRIESRSSTRDASAYEMRCALLEPRRSLPALRAGGTPTRGPKSRGLVTRATLSLPVASLAQDLFPSLRSPRISSRRFARPGSLPVASLAQDLFPSLRSPRISSRRFARPGSLPVASLAHDLFPSLRSPRISSRRFARPGRRHGRATSTISKSDFAAPQSGQLQSSGMSSHRVPGAMPSSGQPLASSYSNPHCTQTNNLNGLVCASRKRSPLVISLLHLSFQKSLRSRPSRALRSPGSTSRRVCHSTAYPPGILLAQRLSPRHRRNHSPGIYRPSCLCSVTGEGLVAHPRVHVGPGDVAVVVLEHPVIHHAAPQWREVGQRDHRRVSAGQVGCARHAAQRLVATRRVGVMIAVPLQVIEEQVVTMWSEFQLCSG